MCSYSVCMLTPTSPDVAHVWLSDAFRVGPPSPALIVAWMPAPVHTAASADWIALVAWSPDGKEILNLSWVGAERLHPVRDQMPASQL